MGLTVQFYGGSKNGQNTTVAMEKVVGPHSLCPTNFSTQTLKVSSFVQPIATGMNYSLLDIRN